MNLRANLYHCLAEALSDPPDWLCWPGNQWPLYEMAGKLAHISPTAAQAVIQLGEISPEALPVRRQRYRALISGSGIKPQVWLYESLHTSGRLVGPETFAVEKAYRDAGLAIQSTELPDHASLELAFLAFLAAKQPETDLTTARPGSEEKRFLRQHAGKWLESLGKQLVRSQDPVYQPIGFLLAGWLAEGRKPKQKAVAGLQTHLPVLEAVEKCTLCGFCAQVCPTKALVMRENEHETGLQLLPAACIHCGKCVKTCETRTLHMAQNSLFTAAPQTRRTLITSQRLACPRCNQPTISQAEMDYMETILGRQAWLLLCLDCRSGVREFSV